MKNVTFRDMFVKAQIAVLNEEDHTYIFNNGQKADFSVTQILNKNNYVSQKMFVAAAVGSKIHEEFAELCRFHLEPGLINALRSRVSNIASEAYSSVFRYLNMSKHQLTEQSLVGSFKIDDDYVYVGGTADLVTISRSDKEDGFDLHVFDLKTATSNEIKSDWRLQIAVYIEFYKSYLESVGYTINKVTGYVVRPGYNYAIPVVTKDNLDQLLEAFKIKLFAARVKETTLTESEKEKINILREQLNYISFDEQRLKTMIKANEEEKQKLLEMLSGVVNDIYKRNPLCAVRDGDFLITPNVTTTTTADTELLKIKNPEAFCKTSVKTSLLLNVQDKKYSCEVK